MNNERNLPTKAEFAERLEMLKVEGLRMIKANPEKYKLNAEQEENLDKIAALTAVHTYKEMIDNYIDAIRKPANEAMIDFIKANR